ncbi:MAG: N,N-dimethylformamidase beta subunit family domain-containing protein, partial [Actinocrinis sp.]
MPYPFVVTNPSSHSDIVVQTSDQTWQAYNMYGGADLYQGNGPAPDGRAYAVSYNRPLNVSGANGVFGSEYAMLQWLERNGYDVSYLSGVDVSTQGSLLLNHKVYMSSGHDEYWNQAQYDAVVAARDAGVNLAFFTGNDVFWRTHLDPSFVDGAANRTVTTYKMTKMEFRQPDGIADPSGQWTGTWMDPAGAGTGGNNPGNALTGSLFVANGYNANAITVSYPYSTDRMWRNTSVASLQPGQTYTMQTGTLGYEWDSDVANAFRPSGEIDMSSTTVDLQNGTLLKDYGNIYGNGTATHNLTLYKAASGALVFSSGTVQWAWGLSTTHFDLTTTEDPVQEQATANLLADMGTQPLTIQSGLTQPARSTDTTGPTTLVATPSSGSTVPAMSPVTFSGTATDSGGGVVARVEVSTDNGATWQPATGLGSWSYSWTPTQTGAVTVKVRAEDDSANVGAVVGIALTVGPQSCPCSIWPNSTVPTKPDSGDGSSVNLGVKFTASTSGAVSGVRFYKTATNVGTHTGSLWTSAGQLLGSVTFTNETPSGWQSAAFSQPIPVSANTTYVVSYLAPSGHYSADANYFANGGAGLAPITANQAGGTSGVNGVYKYGTGTAFPSAGFNNTNYYVDPVFLSNAASTTPPSVTSTQPASGATAVPVNSPITASFSEGIAPSTLVFTVKDPNGVAQSGSASYDPVGHVATFTVNGQLAMNTTYTASVKAADQWGNTMATPYTWSFTTATTPTFTCPCSLWGGTATPANPNTSDVHSVELGVRFQSAVAGWVTGVHFYKGTKNTGTHTG